MKTLSLLLSLLPLTLTIARGEEPAAILQNERLTLSLGSDSKGSIVSVVDKASGTEFIAPQKLPRLFVLTCSKKAELPGERFTLASRDAKTFKSSVRKSGAVTTATLEYDGFGEWPLHVTCTAKVSAKDSLVRWRLSARVPKGLVLEEVQFPFCVLRAPLGQTVDDDAAVLGNAKGGVIRKPGNMKVGSRVYGRQPGSLAAEFGCYYDDKVGFYTAAYDTKGWPKDFEMRRAAEGMEMDWNPHCFATGTVDFKFDVVMTTFASVEANAPTDWRDAADIYKSWALKQPWCATVFEKRTDIPSWMKQGPAMVRFGREWLTTPDKIEKWVENYWKKEFVNAPLITAYWGWEKRGSWVTPDYFPLYPSDEQFTNLVNHLRPGGSHAFPWPSGYHWTLTYQKQPDGSFEWDDRQRFEKIGSPHAIIERNGKVYAHERSWLRGGETSCLCPGDPWTLDFWNNSVCAPLSKRGSEMIQVDQVVGGGFPFCYSSKHAHAPGPGPWMTQVFLRQLKTMMTTCRRIEPASVIGVEEPNERYNHLVGIQDYRDCEMKNEWASVFGYLYHEFLPVFQSNPHAGDTPMMAHCLVTGQMPHMIPMMRAGGPALSNGGFDDAGAGTSSFAGWEHLRGYQGKAWNGKAYRDEADKHGGTSSLRLENTEKSDIVQVSQNVTVSEGGFVGGKRYRLSAWLKTDHMIRQADIAMAAFSASSGFKGVGRIAFPAAGKGWTCCAADFTMPEDATMLRIMINASDKAKLWVDDIKLEAIREDKTLVEVTQSPYPPNHKLMHQWVELFHGVGRPYLEFGRMIHPPKLVTATIADRSRQIPAIFHNAFRASNGREAVIAANASRAKQIGTLFWKNRELHLELQPDEAVLVEAVDGNIRLQR